MLRSREGDGGAGGPRDLGSRQLACRCPVSAAAPGCREGLLQRLDVVIGWVLIIAQRRLAPDGCRDFPDPGGDGGLGPESQHAPELLEADPKIAGGPGVILWGNVGSRHALFEPVPPRRERRCEW